MNFEHPLVFRPWLRPMPWGGEKLATLYPHVSASSTVGEAWLLSHHSLHDSLLENTRNPGITLGEVLKQYPKALLGTSTVHDFPLLIKVLHARENLSVQVHPSDDQAVRWAPRERGKSEAWTILDTTEEGSLYLGLNSTISLKQWREEYGLFDIPETLHRIHPKPGETYAIPPGTIHALGSGVMVLEVQQSSDATFRLFDWDRGRELHVEAGLACLAEHPMAGLQTPVRLSDGSELLVETPFFSMKRWQYAKSATLPAPCIAVIWNGTAKAEGWTLPAGYACLVPACINNAAIEIPNGTIVFVVEWKMQD